jgi:hypothetical protein
LAEAESAHTKAARGVLPKKFERCLRFRISSLSFLVADVVD